MTKKLSLLLLPFCVLPVLSQEKYLIPKIMDQVAKGEPIYEYTDELAGYPPSISLLEELGYYTNAPHPAIRQTAYRLIYQTSILSANEDVRKEAVRLIAENGLADTEPAAKLRVLDYLDEFAPNDFSNSVRTKLASLLVSHTNKDLRLVRLAGRIDLTSVVPVLEQRMADAKKPKEQWAIRLALARMGNESLKTYCLEKVKTLGINDNVTTYLLPDLVYIRSREAIKYMLTLVMQDDDACSSYDPDSERNVNCAFRVLEQVAPHVRDFPVKIKPSGDLDSNDYEQTLAKAREWITLHLETFDPLY
ncbi:MAG: hypothetical protein QM786_00460 [Breznakibacter sp.]